MMVEMRDLYAVEWRFWHGESRITDLAKEEKFCTFMLIIVRAY